MVGEKAGESEKDRDIKYGSTRTEHSWTQRLKWALFWMHICTEVGLSLQLDVPELFYSFNVPYRLDMAYGYRQQIDLS